MDATRLQELFRGVPAQVHHTSSGGESEDSKGNLKKGGADRAVTYHQHSEIVGFEMFRVIYDPFVHCHRASTIVIIKMVRLTKRPAGKITGIFLEEQVPSHPN